MADWRSSNRTSRTNVVHRFGRLPLVNSTTQLVLATYSDIKRTNWLIHSVCGALEGSARLMARVVARSSRPFLDNLESQINFANDLAADRLDKLKEKFPVLQLSVDEVTSHLSESLSLILDDMQEWISVERNHLTGRTRAAMARTRGFVAAQATAFLNNDLGQALEAGGDRALDRLGRMVDHYLPDPEGHDGPAASGFDREVVDRPGIGPRAWRLVAKVRLRCYRQVMVYSQILQEGALTNAMLLTEGLDRLSSGQMFTLMSRALQVLLWFYVARIHHLSRLQGQLQAHLVTAGRRAQSAMGLASVARPSWKAAQLLSQLAELAFLMLLVLCSTLRSLLLEGEMQEEEVESEDESADDLSEMSVWPGCGQSTRGELMLTAIDEAYMQRLLQEARRLGPSSGPEQPAPSPSSEPQSPSYRGKNEPAAGPRRSSFPERARGFRAASPQLSVPLPSCSKD